ncbi:hypothetical protein BDW62DRAFT_174843 [Aspergillus aurantiobrunneus]
MPVARQLMGRWLSSKILSFGIIAALPGLSALGMTRENESYRQVLSFVLREQENHDQRPSGRVGGGQPAL